MCKYCQWSVTIKKDKILYQQTIYCISRLNKSSNSIIAQYTFLNLLCNVKCEFLYRNIRKANYIKKNLNCTDNIRFSEILEGTIKDGHINI